MADVTFTHPDLPDTLFTVVRGSGGDNTLPSNWLTVTGTREVETVGEDGAVTVDTVVVTACGFQGP